MSDLKSLLWNNKTPTSIKNRYKHQSFQLTEWPDFGHVGCPGDYIVLSAYLVKNKLSFSELKSLSSSDIDDINHFLYVCKMLQIIEVFDNSEEPSIRSGLKGVSSILGQKLKSIFFARQVA